MPTVAEAGVPGYDFTIWFAMFAPAATPKAIVTLLNKELVEALAEPEMRERLAKTGVNAGSSTPEALRKHLQAEVAKWAKVVKAAGIPLN